MYDKIKTKFAFVKDYALRRKYLSLTVGAGVVLLLFITLGGSPNEDANTTLQIKQRVIRVQTWTVTPITLNDILTLPGATEALHDVTVAAERSGKVEWMGPKRGDEVAANESIARIDLDNAHADLSKAKAAYKLAKEMAERRSELLEQKVLSKEELDKANTELSAARSQLTQARKAFAQGNVTSPVPGIINDLFVDPGEWVNMGQPVAEVVNISTILINVNVPELDVRYLEKGQQVHVSVDAYPDDAWNGVVDFVAFKADETTKTFRVRIVVDNADMRIRPGMLARVSMSRQVIDNAVTAPLHAIIDKGGEKLLFVAENEIAKARTVTFGVISGSRIQILSGLRLGDALIVSGQTEVEEGVAVKVTGEMDENMEALAQ